MKVVSFFVACFLVVVTSAFAEAEAPAFTKTINLDLLSQYVGPGGLPYTHGAVFQPSVYVSHESGFYLSLWGSGAFRNEDKYGRNEIDYFAGWAGDVGPVSIDTGVGYYDFYEFNKRSENAWAMYITVSKKFELKDSGVTLTPSLRFEENIPEPGSSYGSDFFTSAGLEIRKEVVKKVDVFFLPALVYDNGIYGERCTTISLQCGLNIALNDRLKLKPKTIFYFPFEKNDRMNEIIYGAGLEYSF